MVAMIIGGSASGKSEYAERHVISLDGNRIYLATMEPFGSDAERRIERHRTLRQNRGFETIERYTAIDSPGFPPDTNLLIEDLGNLLANERYHADGGGAEAVLSGLRSAAAQCRHLTVVTNEVFCDGNRYAGDTAEYLSDLAEINREFAKQADLVVEVVCGLPNLLKGETV